MLHNYLKIAFRNLRKHRIFTLTNALGLSVGMAACLLILQYVRFEWGYDHISDHTHQLWRAFNETVTDGKVTTQDCNTHSKLGPSLKADLPEVTDFFRLYNRNEGELVFFQNNRPVKVRHAWMTDPGFLRMYPQRFVAGDPVTCLNEPWKMVITESIAKQLFPNENALGKPLRVLGEPFKGDYIVEGIVADPPQNTHLKFNVLTGYATRYAKGHEDNWSGYWDYTYFQLGPGADPEKVRRQLAAYSESHLKNEGIRLAMQPFEDIHLHSDLTYEIEPNGSARNVRFLGLMALFILAIAFVNYVNMTTARSLERAKEVGLRKVIGAGRWQLAGQFLLEGLLLNAVALVLGLALYQSLLPAFSSFMGRPLGGQAFDGAFWLPLAGLFLVGVLASSGYPALALSRFAPLEVLNGSGSTFKGLGGMGREGLLRRGLVVLQFGCSAALIFALTVVGQQLNFLNSHDKGLSLHQIVAVKTPPPDWKQDSLNRLRLTALKHEIGQISGVSSVTASSVAPSLGISTISGTSSGLVLAEKPSDLRSGTIYLVDAEPDFYKTYGIRFLAGEPYRAGGQSRELGHVVINRKALEMLGIPSPEAALGEEIAYANNPSGYRMKIEGVVENFHIETLKEPARPTIYPCLQDVRNGFVSVKLEAAQAQPVLASMERAWKQSFPESPFEYWFLDEQFALQYQSEAQLGMAFGLFAALAIFIACLGLFGMSTYAAAQRTKEIGVRKVLGASVSGIVGLLAKDFLKPVALGVFLAMPFAWHFMERWLQDFAYRIDIQWTVFALAGITALVVAFLTVSFQSVKAALANPVKSLRSE
jgi:putative ABC transport system permease protein